LTEKTTISGNFSYSTRRAWDEARYGGLKEQVLVNPDGTQSENLAIVKNNKIVNVMSDKYFVFPNADLDDILTEVAKDVGATPYFKETSEVKTSWFKSSDNILSDAKYGTRALINFKFDKVADVTGRGDTVQFGFGGSNSEDGRGGALKILGLNVRAQCDNLAYTFVPSTELKEAEKIGASLWHSDKHKIHDPSVEIAKQNVITAKAELDLKTPKFYSKHSKSVSDLDNLKDQIRVAVEKIKADSDRVISRYRQLYQTKLNVYTATRIKNEIPHSIVKDLNYIEYDKKTEQVTVAGDVNDWTVYNDITEALTYSKSRTFGSTIGKFKKLENIFIEDPLVVTA